MTENLTLARGQKDNPRQVEEVIGHLSAALARFPETWIEGEITEYKRWNGRAFLTLADLRGGSRLEFFLLASAAKIPAEVGDRVKIRGRVEIWTRSGQLKIHGFEMAKVGLGELVERLERLRAQLEGEGLFRADRKKPLPYAPKVIGLITGKNSDAEKDVKRNVFLRWPLVRFKTEYALMQGPSCPDENIQKLRILDADAEVEVIIIARGGGGAHDLLGFSDEALVRAVSSCFTPVISAIGHENDRPLLDEVADLRASTPTDAAKRVVPDKVQTLRALGAIRAEITRRLHEQLAYLRQDLNHQTLTPVLARPLETLIQPRYAELDLYGKQLSAIITRKWRGLRRDLEGLARHLEAVSVQNVLTRGFALATKQSGQTITSSQDVEIGEKIALRLARGTLLLQVIDRENPLSNPIQKPAA